MKLQYDAVRDHSEVRQLVKLFIRQRKGSIVSGMDMRIWVNSTYGIDIDHHEYAYALDQMTRSEEVTYHNHHSGDTQYLVL